MGIPDSGKGYFGYKGYQVVENPNERCADFDYLDDKGRLAYQKHTSSPANSETERLEVDRLTSNELESLSNQYKGMMGEFSVTKEMCNADESKCAPVPARTQLSSGSAFRIDHYRSFISRTFLRASRKRVVIDGVLIPIIISKSGCQTFLPSDMKAAIDQKWLEYKSEEYHLDLREEVRNSVGFIGSFSGSNGEARWGLPPYR